MGTERKPGRLSRMEASAHRLEARLEAYNAGLYRPYAELRQQVHDFAEGQWGKPTGVIQLGKVEPRYKVPGRRGDGTVRGRGLVLRFFSNIFRGAFNAVVNVFTLLNMGGVVDVFDRKGVVTGSADGQVLGLVDAARRAQSAWLVHTESYVAVIDSGSDLKDVDPQPLQVLWHAEKPNVPKVIHRDKRAVWPDGSEFRYDVSVGEAEVASRDRKAWLWRDRTLDP